MNNLKLYEVTDKFITLFEKAQTEELTEEEIQEQGNELALALKNKSQNIIAYDREMQLTTIALDTEIKRLTELKKAIENKSEKFKEYVKNNMEKLGVEKIETAIGNLSIKKNPPSIEILSEEDVPSEFKKEKLTITIDKTAIKKHFNETGEIIPGTTVITDKTRLEIK